MDTHMLYTYTHICICIYINIHVSIGMHMSPMFSYFLFQRSHVYSCNFLFVKSSNTLCYGLAFIKKLTSCVLYKWFGFWTTKLVLPIIRCIAWPLRSVDDDVTILLPIFKFFMEDKKVLV